MHNVFVGRLWRSIKYEEACLKAYDTVSDAKQSLGTCFDLIQHQTSAPGTAKSDSSFGIHLHCGRDSCITSGSAHTAV